MDLLFGLSLGLLVASPLFYGAWRLHRTAKKLDTGDTP